MFAVQKRDSENSAWHTCSNNKKKCRYSDLDKAKRELLKRSKSAKERHPRWQYRILDTLSDNEIFIDGENIK